MSKNKKHTSAFKLRTKGKGKRDFKRSLRIINMGGGDSFNFTDGVSLHTPLIYIMEKRAGKLVKLPVYVMDDREARKGLIQKYRDVESGVCMMYNKSPIDNDKTRDAILRTLGKEIELPGTVSKQWKGSNRHDRPRDDIESEPNNKPQEEVAQ
jgi:hypothetical protein